MHSSEHMSRMFIVHAINERLSKNSKPMVDVNGFFSKNVDVNVNVVVEQSGRES